MSQLTEQDIEEMERAEKAAEAGPWDTDTSVCVVTSQESDIASVDYPGDARFIARARSFVPRAIADLRRLRAENERLARENSVILDGQAALKSDLELATERAERAERERDELLAECRLWRSEIIGERASYDLRLEAAIEKFDEEGKS